MKKKSSTFKGVTFSKARHKWMAKAFVDGKTVYFGLYNTEVAAAKAYDKGVVHLLPQKIINFRKLNDKPYLENLESCANHNLLLQTIPTTVCLMS